MTRSILLFLVPMTLLFGACDKGDTDASQDPSERSGEGRGHRWLNKLDTDKDGALSQAEVKDRPRLAERFTELDADKDGKLSRDELAAIKKGHHGDGRDEDPAARAARKIARLDADKDGALSLPEVQDHHRLAEQFAELDADKDGKLTQAELAAMKGHEKGPHGDPAEHAARKLARLDADKDGALSQAEVKDHRRLSERFAEIDADKDGKLTQAELAAMKKGHHGDGHHGHRGEPDGE